MSLATVYKTLGLLKEMGEVLELGFRNDDNRYDAHDPAPHPHIICTNCRRIVDLDVAEFEFLARDIAASSGFQVASYRLDFFGVCPDCQEREPD
jgi:Fur family peroxide stress response transcriptional regulator